MPFTAKQIVAWTMCVLLAVMPPAAAQQPAPRPPVLPPGFGARVQPQPVQPKAEQPKPEQPKAAGQVQAAPETAKPAGPGQEAAKQEAAKQEAPGQEAPAAPVTAPAATYGGLNLQNVNLVEVIDYLARELKINYVIDPSVKGSVTLNTYGEARDIDPRQLLDTVLRINGYAMVQNGPLFRIVQLQELNTMPLRPNVDAASIPDDDQAMLNLVFLKYANAEELAKLLGEFLGTQGRIWSYPSANLLLVLDGRRNMKRTMELVAMFDSDTLARQRVRLFEVKHSRPSDLASELEKLLKSISMGKDLSSVRFVPVDRISLLIAVAPNPGVFTEVEQWLAKLDVRVDRAAGRTDTFVYRVRYGRADMLAFAIMSLYYSLQPGLAGLMMMPGMLGMGGMGMGMGGMGMGGMGMGGMGMGGMGMGGMGMGGMGMGGMGMGGMGGMGMNPMAMMGMGGMGMNPMAMMGMGGMGMNPMAMMGMGGMGMNPMAMMGMGGMGMGGMGMGAARTPGQAGAAGAAGADPSRDRTGEFLGGGAGAGMPFFQGPRVVPNVLDNSLLILATGEEYQAILNLLRDLDIPPRQVLIEARIYEVSLTGSLSNGVAAFLRQRGAGGGAGAPAAGALHQLTGSMNANISLTAGMLIGQSRELLAFLNSAETRTRARVISAPSVVATDSIPAAINVGIDVPMLSAQAVSGGMVGGTSLFANTIANRRTGVGLSITARVNPSGVVTLEIDQEVSAPQAPAAGAAIQSPAFSQRNIRTQVTVQDNDLVAIGGIINESNTDSSTGIPFLTRIPGLGAAFSSRLYTRERTELVVFLTPRVIRDTTEMVDATEEIKSGMRRIQRMMRE